MNKLVSKQSLAVMALSILLAISMALTATFAAFGATAKITGSIQFTDTGFAIEVTNIDGVSNVVGGGEKGTDFALTQGTVDLKGEGAATYGFGDAKIKVTSAGSAYDSANNITISIKVTAEDTDTVLAAANGLAAKGESWTSSDSYTNGATGITIKNTTANTNATYNLKDIVLATINEANVKESSTVTFTLDVTVTVTAA